MNVLTLFSAVYSASIITNSKVIALNKYLLNEQMKEGRGGGRKPITELSKKPEGTNALFSLQGETYSY